MVFNATYNNISVYRGVSGDNYRPAASHRQILSHNVVFSTSHQARDAN
jgi:hypothetical protein